MRAEIQTKSTHFTQKSISLWNDPFPSCKRFLLLLSSVGMTSHGARNWPRSNGTIPKKIKSIKTQIFGFGRDKTLNNHRARTRISVSSANPRDTLAATTAVVPALYSVNVASGWLFISSIRVRTTPPLPQISL